MKLESLLMSGLFAVAVLLCVLTAGAIITTDSATYIAGHATPATQIDRQAA